MHLHCPIGGANGNITDSYLLCHGQEPCIKCRHAHLQEDTERRMEWKQVLDSTIAVLQEQLAMHPQTGLLADFLVYSTSEKRYKPAAGELHLLHPMMDNTVCSRHSLWLLKALNLVLTAWSFYLKARFWRRTMMVSMAGTPAGECQAPCVAAFVDLG